MSITLTQIQTESLSYVGAPDDTDAQAVATGAANSAIRRLDSKEWWWSLMLKNHTLVAGTSIYALAADFKAPRSMELLDGSSNVIGSIAYMSPRDFTAMLADYGTGQPAQGDPCYYTVYNSHESDQDDVQLDIAPSAAFISQYPTARQRYFRRTTRLASGSDVLDAPSEVEEFVVWHARAILAATYQPDKYDMAVGERESVWAQLLRNNMRVHLRDW